MDGWQNYTCECPAGYEGFYCEIGEHLLNSVLYITSIRFLRVIVFFFPLSIRVQDSEKGDVKHIQINLIPKLQTHTKN